VKKRFWNEKRSFSASHAPIDGDVRRYRPIEPLLKSITYDEDPLSFCGMPKFAQFDDAPINDITHALDSLNEFSNTLPFAMR